MASKKRSKEKSTPSTSTKKAKGMSLHIGLNSVDPSHYGGWSGRLAGCENDADDMETLAQQIGYTTTKLLTKSATASAVAAQIATAAQSLRAGDIFFVTYSGHGGRVPDVNGDEPDGYDETWVLYDRELLDDEIYAGWAKFARGVRILVLSDSCHSGTVVKMAGYRGLSPDSPKRFRAMPIDVEQATWTEHERLYTRLQLDEPYSAEKGDIGASILLISGCQDWQLSADGASNGLFTGTLKKVWNDGKFTGSYPELHEAIWTRMPPSQKPNYFKAGRPSAAFEKERPFSV